VTGDEWASRDNIHRCPEETKDNFATAATAKAFTAPSVSPSKIEKCSAVRAIFLIANAAITARRSSAARFREDTNMSNGSECRYPEKRLNRRAKMARMLRVRPSDPEQDHFDDLPISVNVSKNGIFFHTNRAEYQKGMRLFITYPFSFKDDAMKCEYIGEVVRVENLGNNRFGIAVHLLMTV
jgi:PilZ domain